MATARQDHDLRFPRGWPSRVRSAVIHAISLAHASLVLARSSAANSWNARIRLKADNERLRQEVALLGEELRIKDSRMQRIPAQRRPHYPPVERLAILELRAARGWSQSQTAERFLITPATVASWMTRLDEEGPNALVQIREPVNKFPEFVAYVVQRLKVLCPTMGKVRIAQVLCRAGLHLGSTTVRRLLQDSPRRDPRRAAECIAGGVTARHPNHVWHIDLTTVPTALGFWASWLPFTLPQRWPFCWWLAVVVDHYSRRAMGVVVLAHLPSSAEIQVFLADVARRVGVTPNHLITDHGKQFVAATVPTLVPPERNSPALRGRSASTGALRSSSASSATTKNECTRRILVPYRLAEFQREISLYATWYNGDRPHAGLGGRTPNELYYARRPACRAPRFEPRAPWPRRSPCAGPQALVRGWPGVVIDLSVSYRAGRKHLPLVTLKRAA